MKFGPRRPNYKKRLKAQTTGKMKRKIKKSVNPLYGKKGMGWVNDPKKAAYNKVYNKTTFDAVPSISNSQSTSSLSVGCLTILLLFVSIAIPPLFIISLPLVVYNYTKQKKETEKNKYHQLLAAKLSELENLVQQANKIKGLEPFFERVDTIRRLKEEAFDLVDRGFEKEFIEEKAFIKGKENINEVINNLLKNYVDRYEASSHKEAMELKTETGQINNYKRSYDDLQAYKQYFTSNLKQYIDGKWREL